MVRTNVVIESHVWIFRLTYEQFVTVRIRDHCRVTDQLMETRLLGGTDPQTSFSSQGYRDLGNSFTVYG